MHLRKFFKNIWLPCLALFPQIIHAGSALEQLPMLIQGQMPLPKDVHIEHIKDQTTGEMVEIEMINSPWPAGDGDKPRIEDNDIFKERLEYYQQNKGEMIEKLRDGEIYWQTSRINPKDFRLCEPFWSSRLEKIIFEMGLLVSEGSYLDAVHETYYRDIRRVKRWYLTRGKSEKDWHYHCDGRSSDYMRDYRSGINVVKAYVNAVTKSNKAYSDLLLYDPKFKYKLQKMEEKRGHQWFIIQQTAQDQRIVTWAAEGGNPGPPPRSKYTFESQNALSEKNKIEAARKLLILNYRFEAEISKILFEKQKNSNNTWAKKYLQKENIQIPNIDPDTGETYDPGFESILPGYDVLDPRVNHHLNGVKIKLDEDGRIVDPMRYYEGYMLDQHIFGHACGGRRPITGVFFD